MSGDKFPETEYIEIKYMPDGIVDLAEFISALEAINAEYRQWLREHEQYDHRDKDLRLQPAKIDEGSIVVWLTKAANLTFDVLEFFFKKKLEDAISSIIDRSGLTDLSSKSLRNYRSLLRYKVRAKYFNPRTGSLAEFELNNEKIIISQNNITEALGADEKHTEIHENISIRVTGFHIESPAKVIAVNISENEVKSFMTDEIRSYFINQEKQNFLSPSKEYLVNLEATFSHGELDFYRITKILGS